MGVLAVVKLGGSFLSDKKRQFSVRRRALDAAIRTLSGQKLAFVHGGGSFGHPVAKKYGLSSSAPSGGRGVAETREAMQRLDSIIVASMLRAKFKPYVLPAVSLLGLNMEPRSCVHSILAAVLRGGLTPLTYGDVVPVVGGFRIVSGDLLSMLLCDALKPARMVFVIDKPGILSDPDDEDTLLRRVYADELLDFAPAESADATGGFRNKLEAAGKISESGVETVFVSGFDRDALIKSVLGGQFKGTLVMHR